MHRLQIKRGKKRGWGKAPLNPQPELMNKFVSFTDIGNAARKSQVAMEIKFERGKRGCGHQIEPRL